jgi:uncharacterized protein YqeY
MENKIQKDIMSAMKEKDEVRLSALRAIKTAIMRTKTAADFKGDREAPLSDAEVIKIMQKLVKTMNDSITIYMAVDRDDLALKERNELSVIEEYLPKPLSELEIETLVKEAITETGATSIKDMGKVIGVVTQKAEGRADGKTISGIVKKLLS